MTSRSSKKKKARFEDNVDDVQTPDDSSYEYVENICTSLSTCSQDQKDRLFLVLTDGKLKYTGTHPAVDRSRPDRNRISLEKLLLPTFRSTKCFHRLNKCECLSFAINLASSLLQLHMSVALPNRAIALLGGSSNATTSAMPMLGLG